MIRLSAAAQTELFALTAYYADRGRDRAIDRLIEAVARACARCETKQGLFYSAPRPYPGLAEFGFRWTKEGSYWIAFDETAGEIVVAGIFHEAADIPRRI